MPQRTHIGILAFALLPGTSEAVWMVRTGPDIEEFVEVEVGDYLQVSYSRLPGFIPDMVFDGQVKSIDMRPTRRIPRVEGFSNSFMYLVVRGLVQFNATIRKESESFLANLFKKE